MSEIITAALMYTMAANGQATRVRAHELRVDQIVYAPHPSRGGEYRPMRVTARSHGAHVHLIDATMFATNITGASSRWDLDACDAYVLTPRESERGEASVLVLGALSALVGLALAPVVMLGMVAVCVALMALATRSARPEVQARRASELRPTPHYADHAEGACEGSPTWEAAWSGYDDQPSPPTTIYAL